MREYCVCFTRRWYYDVIAKNEAEAIEFADKEFDANMFQPIKPFWYDEEVEIWEMSEHKEKHRCLYEE